MGCYEQLCLKWKHVCGQERGPNLNDTHDLSVPYSNPSISIEHLTEHRCALVVHREPREKRERSKELRKVEISTNHVYSCTQTLSITHDDYFPYLNSPLNRSKFELQKIPNYRFGLK
ncbi:hypothetical protein PV326_002677 [Microctonus aethiopoides]|nr:hypothetical protein PV326_002677 [Microctonus aethiopoides]